MSEDHDVPFIDGKMEKLNELSAELVNVAPTDADTHAALAIVRFLNEWRWAETETEFKRALDLNPDCRMALTYYGYLLTRQGRAVEARVVLQRALDSNPDSPLITKFLGHAEFAQRHFEKALPFYERASVLEPSYPSGHYWAGRVHFALTNYPQALAEMEQHELKQGLDPSWTRDRHKEYRATWEKVGSQGYWTNQIEMVDQQDARANTPDFLYVLAMRYARAGDRQQALVWLEQAFVQRASMENLLVDEVWDDYRHEQRFNDILKKVGLPWQR